MSTILWIWGSILAALFMAVVYNLYFALRCRWLRDKVNTLTPEQVHRIASSDQHLNSMVYKKWWVWDIGKLVPIAAAILLTSCTMTDEQGSRGGQQLLGNVEGGLLASAPDTYRFRNWQMGGVSTWQNSMGSSMTVDNQASFKDAAQAIGVFTTTVYAYKAYAAAELTKRILEGEITKRQGAELANKLALATTQAEVDMFMAGLEVLP